jgi:hypothetical protein
MPKGRKMARLFELLKFADAAEWFEKSVDASDRNTLYVNNVIAVEMLQHFA